MTKKVEDKNEYQDQEPRHPKETRVLRRGAQILAMTGTTHYWTGRVVDFDAFSIVLEDSAWVSEVATQELRHAGALSSGQLNEVEPHPDLMEIPRAGTVCIPWPHPLPRKQQ